MNRRSLLALLTLILFSAPTFASTADAEQRLQAAVNEVLTVADKAPDRTVLLEKLRPILEKHLSFAAMTRRAVGPGWRQFSAAQRNEATDLFTTLIIRTYSSRFTPGERPEITFKPATETSPGRFEVPTTLVYKGSRYVAIYRMEVAENWKITDVVIEGVSLIANYRTQFDAEFKKGGAAAVIQALTQSVNQSK